MKKSEKFDQPIRHFACQGFLVTGIFQNTENSLNQNSRSLMMKRSPSASDFAWPNMRRRDIAHINKTDMQLRAAERFAVNNLQDEFIGRADIIAQRRADNSGRIDDGQLCCRLRADKVPCFLLGQCFAFVIGRGLGMRRIGPIIFAEIGLAGMGLGDGGAAMSAPVF